MWLALIVVAVVSVAALPIIRIAFTAWARKGERQMLEKSGEEYRAYQPEGPDCLMRSRTSSRRSNREV